MPRLSPTTIYKIINVQTETVFTVHKTDYIAGYPYNSLNIDSQKWYAVPIPGASDVYLLKMTQADAFLGLNNGSDEHLLVGPGKYEWVIIPGEDEATFKIYAKAEDAERCLQLDMGDVKSWPQIRVAPEEQGLQSQVWKFEPAGPAPPPPDPPVTTLVAAVADRRTVRFWDPASGRLVHSVAVNLRFGDLAAIPRNGDRLAFMNHYASNIYVHDIRSSANPEGFTVGYFEYQELLELSPDGSRLAAANNKQVTIYNLQSATEQRTIFYGGSDSRNSARVVRFKGDNRRLAIGFQDSTIRVWDLYTYAERTLVMGPPYPGTTGYPVLSLAWAPPFTDALLTSRHTDPTLVLWNTLDGTRIRTFYTHPAFQNSSMSFFPDNRLLKVAIVGAYDAAQPEFHWRQSGIIQIWELLAWNSPPVTIIDGDEAFTYVDVSPDGTMITASPLQSRSVRVWDAQTLQRTNTIPTDANQLHPLGFMKLP